MWDNVLFAVKPKGMQMKNWKYIAFVSYKKIQDVIAILDFNYPIEIADNDMKVVYDQIKSIVSLTSVKDSEFYVEKEDKWHLCVEKTIILLEESINVESDIRRKERYYGVLNYITGFIEMYDCELV